MKKFMRTRDHAPDPAPQAAAVTLHPHTKLNGHTYPSNINGHANGGASAVSVVRGERRGGHDEQRSSSGMSSRGQYWSGSGSGTGPGALWEDSEFPPARALHKRHAKNVVWMRPYELCARPTFRGDGACDLDDGHVDEHDDEHDDETEDELAARWNVEVGALGCAALCQACAALALTPRLLARLAPPHSFRRNYTGAFRFMFWVFGVWREVVVDDRLPTRCGRLLSSVSDLHGDFTMPLLEKAYAKLYGGYSALKSVEASQALQDVSGGVVQSFSLRATPAALTLQVLHSAVPRSTLMVAGAHVVSGLARVRGGPGGGGTLVRLRAASGRRAGSGAWSTGSAQWRALSAPDRDLLDQRTLNRGEFWMSFVEFTSHFSTLVLVHVGPDDWVSEPALQARRPWRAVLARRRWRAGYNAGGPPPSSAAAGANPQFHVCVPAGLDAGKCHVVVSVTQQYSAGADSPRSLHSVGFAVYELPPDAPAPSIRHHDLRGLRLLDVTHCSRAREVATFFTLPAGSGAEAGAGAGAGQYLVVPHTQRAHTEAGFLLRILTDEHTHVWEVNEDNAISHDISAEFPERGQPVPVNGGVRVGGAAAARAGGGGGGGGRGGGGRGGCAAARVARVPGGAALAGAVPRAGGAARRARARRHAGVRAARARGAAGALAGRVPAGGAAALPVARRHGQLVPRARAAAPRRRVLQQQGGGVRGAAVRARPLAGAGGLRDGARQASPSAPTVPQPRLETEVQSYLPRRDDPDDYLLVRLGVWWGVVACGVVGRHVVVVFTRRWCLLLFFINCIVKN